MPAKPRAVMDTNVLYAALRSSTGASYEVLRRLRAGEWTLLLSNTVVTEYEEILQREAADLGLDPAEIGPLLDDLCLLAERHPRLEPREPMLPHPDDEAFAQLAVAAGLPLRLERGEGRGEVSKNRVPTTWPTLNPPAASAFPS